MVHLPRALLLVGACLAAAFLLAMPLAAAAPSIAITPQRASAETEFIAELRGFTPGEKLALRLTSTTTPRELTIPAVTIDASGGYRLSILALALTPGDYTLTALRGTEAVASAGFTVIASATPTRAMPSTTPAPTATRPAPTPAAPAPTPPTTGSGGNLPGLPSTGDGGSQFRLAIWAVPLGLLTLTLGGLRLRRKSQPSARDAR